MILIIIALTANCICFLQDEIPFIQAQVALNMSETHLKHIDSEFTKLKDDLKNHKNGILEKLSSMLTERYVISLNHV